MEEQDDQMLARRPQGTPRAREERLGRGLLPQKLPAPSYGPPRRFLEAYRGKR